MFLPEPLPALATALGLGLLIGVVRERHVAENPGQAVVAGVRTHALTALAGAAAWWLGLPAFIVVLAAAGVFVALAYLHSRAQDPGLTGEFALLLTCLLGGLAMRGPALAAGLAVVVAVLLQAKQPLHRLSRELLSEGEVHDGLVLLASALIVLPLLPNRALGPFGVFNPATLWTLVVLVMAISALGHIALRVVGHRWGLAMAGFFAGYVSSTAAVAGFGERVRETPSLLRPAVGAAMLANLASLSLMLPLLLAIAPDLVGILAWPLGGAALVLTAGGLMGLGVAHGDGEPPPTAERRMFRFSHAFGFALLVSGVLFLSAALNAWLGPHGALTAAVLAALAEVHAATATVGNLYAGGALDAGDARWGLVGLLAASGGAKTVVAALTGGRDYGLRVGAGLAFSTIAAALGAIVAVLR